MKSFTSLLVLPTFVALGGRPAGGEGVRVFFGNLHSHTSYSDGSGTPEEAYRHARDLGKLDFLAITEHNHAKAENGASSDRKDGKLIGVDSSLYTGPDPDALIPTANGWTQPGRFVALYGQEFSSISRGNHVNVFDVPEVIDVTSGHFRSLLEWLDDHRDSTGAVAVVQFNHPALFDGEATEYGADDFDTPSEWIRRMDAVSHLIEIANGPAMTRTGPRKPAEIMEDDYRHFLNLGFHLAPTANQDNHYFTWGTATNARTAVLTDELTKPKVLAALRNRHVYATEDKNLRLVFRVNGHLIGDRVSPPPVPDTALHITYSIRDDDEPESEYTVEVHSDTIGGEDEAELVEFDVANGNTPDGDVRTIDTVHYRGGLQYLFFKVIQSDEDGETERAWTAPVWFEPAGAVPAAVDGTAALIASKRSRVYHVSLECIYAQRIHEPNRVTGEEAATNRRLHRGCPRRRSQ